jgi:hypothetical protein
VGQSRREVEVSRRDIEPGSGFRVGVFGVAAAGEEDRRRVEGGRSEEEPIQARPLKERGGLLDDN